MTTDPWLCLVCSQHVNLIGDFKFHKGGAIHIGCELVTDEVPAPQKRHNKVLRRQESDE